MFECSNRLIFLLPCFINPDYLPSITNADDLCVDEDHDE